MHDCFLRYSDTNSITSDEKSCSTILYNVNNISNTNKFEDVYSNLMGSFADRAANSTNLFKFDTAKYTASISNPTMKFPLFPILFFFLLSASPGAQAAYDGSQWFQRFQSCGTTGNYTANSTYEANLRTLFTELTKNGTNFGFAKSSIGSAPNLVSGLVLCRGDVNFTACSSCLNQATQDIQNLCPYYKKAIMYYDLCFLQYSNKNFLSSPDYNFTFLEYTRNVNVSFTLSDNLVKSLMNSTADYAAFNDSKKFGTSQMITTDSFPVIRGLVQCTPDMSGANCRLCLQHQIGNIDLMPELSGTQGGRIFNVWCNIQYDIYQFYTGSALLTLTAPAENGPAPAPSEPPFRRNLSGRATAGIVTGAIAILLSTGLVFYCLVDKRKKAKKASVLPQMSGESPVPLVAGFTVVKSVEFSYEELSKATNDFSMANKIGQGGSGSVYYAVLRGEKAAIKKMEAQASNLFHAELNVLTHVHHSNLVRLIGYCIEGALFLVYEYIENGDLSQHLCSSGRWSPLLWADRVQIALDSARGIEYFHEHTVPVYIHRDIKSANILIDEKGRAKVADFGLAKLTKVGSKSFLTGRVGTIGYMSPEYGQYGSVSPKVDVYAFGVVLYELISAKRAIVIIEPSSDASSEAKAKGLVRLFDDALMDGDSKENIKKLVDPRLGNDYPIESVMKMVQLAKACTQYKPHKRSSMRSVVVTLMAVADLISAS